MIGRLLCALGLHDRYFAATSFVYICTRCAWKKKVGER